MHSERNGAAHPSYISYISYRLKSEVSIALRSQVCSIAFRIEKHLCNTCSYINHCLKREVSITLRCWLCSIRYTAL